MKEVHHYPEAHHKPANPRQVPNLSPLRYPGGKTWLIPHLRFWMSAYGQVETFIEPFAGGATASLLALHKRHAKHAVMLDIDPKVSAFWMTATHDPNNLIQRIHQFDPGNTDKLRWLQEEAMHNEDALAFLALVESRLKYNGINGPRSGSINNGATQHSRWYPDTLIQRIETIKILAPHLEFYRGDGPRLMFKIIHANPETAIAFIDPPYIGDSQRYYNHMPPAYDFTIQRWMELFDMLYKAGAHFMLTSSDHDHIRRLVYEYRFAAKTVQFKNGKHTPQTELIVTNVPWKQL